MRILQITPYFLPHIGGIERFVFNLSTFLVSNNHDVTIITSNIPKQNNFEIIKNIKISRFYCIGEPLKSPISPSILGISKKIQESDILHVHNVYSFGALCCLFYAIRSKTPILLTHHGQHKFGSRLGDFFLRVYRTIFENLILHSVDGIVVLSQSDANYIFEFGIRRDKVYVIPNAINPYDFQDYQNNNLNILFSNLNIGTKQVILYVGLIINRKGINYLIQAINLIKEELRHSNYVVLIVGEGDYLENAIQNVHHLNIEDLIIFTGKLQFEELIQAYKNSDIYILPSLSEGLPTTILEAMYFELPVISTNIPGIWDHFSDTAVLVKPKNEIELSDAIMRLIRNPGLKRQLAEKGHDLVVNNYTWDKTTQQYISLYYELISKKKI